MPRFLRFALAAVAFSCALSASTIGAVAQAPSSRPKVIFVCLHGSVKSQVAAAHFNRLASERGLSYVALSRGMDVDKSIPASIRHGLASDGLAPASETPESLTAGEAADAVKVFAFDAVPPELRGESEVTYWSDVPPATKDYEASRSAIVRHIEEILGTLPQTKP
jgi:protein-tyrosine-phosphatase